MKHAAVNKALEVQHLVSHNLGIYTMLKMEMILYLCQEKLYQLQAHDDNTDENYKAKNCLLSWKCH